MNIPSRRECLTLLEQNKTPSNVVEHCKAVCRIAETVTLKMMARGIEVNKDLVTAAALLHDIQRAKKDHVALGAKLIEQKGYPEVAAVMRKHSLYRVWEEDKQPKTREEKIVFYADKRVRNDHIVSLDERFDDIEERYTVKVDRERTYTKELEKELLGL